MNILSILESTISLNAPCKKIIHSLVLSSHKLSSDAINDSENERIHFMTVSLIWEKVSWNSSANKLPFNAVTIHTTPE